MRNTVLSFLIMSLFTNVLGPLSLAYGQDVRSLNISLPKPSVRVQKSEAFNPLVLKGIKVNPHNPLKFDFVLNQGDNILSPEQIKIESQKLVRYFLAAMTVPENDLWVNLSPYEKNRVIPENFGLTEMGRDLLAQDYLLKQITSSLMYPEHALGKEFWRRIYAQLPQKANQINTSMFHKVWIVPDKALVYENVKNGVAYIVNCRLKLMLESDYLAMKKENVEEVGSDHVVGQETELKKIVKEIILPELEREVNEGKNFAPLRQVYHSLILAQWFKRKMKRSILSRVFIDQHKIKGAEYQIRLNRNADQSDTDYIYQQYLRAFKQGVYNYIKEERDQLSQKIIPRRYFAGGMQMVFGPGDLAMTTDKQRVTDRKAIIENIDLEAIMSSHLNPNQAMSVQNQRTAKEIISAFKEPGKEPKNILITLLSTDDLHWGDQIVLYRVLLKALIKLWPQVQITAITMKDNQSIFEGFGDQVKIIDEKNPITNQEFDLVFKGGERRSGFLEDRITKLLNQQANQINLFTIYSNAVSLRHNGFYRMIEEELKHIGLDTAKVDLGESVAALAKTGPRVVFLNILAETNKDAMNEIRSSFINIAIALINQGYQVVINGGPSRAREDLPGGLPHLFEPKKTEAHYLLDSIKNYYEFKYHRPLSDDLLQLKEFVSRDAVVNFMREKVDVVLTIDTGLFWAANLLAHKPSVVITTEQSYLPEQSPLDPPNYYSIDKTDFSNNPEAALNLLLRHINNSSGDNREVKNRLGNLAMNASLIDETTGIQAIKHDDIKNKVQEIIKTNLVNVLSEEDRRNFIGYLLSLYQKHKIDSITIFSFILEVINKSIMHEKNYKEIQNRITDLLEKEKLGIYGKYHAIKFINYIVENTNVITKENVVAVLDFIIKIIINHQSYAYDALKSLKAIFIQAKLKNIPEAIDLERLNKLADIKKLDLWNAYEALLAKEVVTTDNLDEVDRLLTEAIPYHMYDVGHFGNSVNNKSYEALIQMVLSASLTRQNINQLAQFFRHIGDMARKSNISSYRVRELLAAWARFNAINASNIEELERVFTYLLDVVINAKDESKLTDLEQMIFNVNQKLTISEEARKIAMPAYFSRLDHIKNILWLRSLYSYGAFDELLARIINANDLTMDINAKLITFTRNDLIAKLNLGHDVGEVLKKLIVHQILLSPPGDYLSENNGTYTAVIPEINSWMDIDTSPKNNVKQRILARIVELASIEKIVENGIIFKIDDTERLRVNFVPIQANEKDEVGLDSDKLNQLMKKLLFYQLTNPELSAKMNPLNQYFLQLELLNQEGLLQGRILYPSMGNDYFPSYFGFVFATNLFSGLGPDLETILEGRNFVQAGLGFEYLTLNQLKDKSIKQFDFSQVWRNQETALRVFWENNFNTAIYFDQISASGRIDTLIIKGVTRWLKHYFEENATQGHRIDEVMKIYFDHLNRDLIKPGTKVIILDLEDFWMEDFLKKQYGYTSLGDKPSYKDFIEQLNKVSVRPQNVWFGHVNTHVGILPIRILEAPDKVEDISTGGIDLTSDKALAIDQEAGEEMIFDALDPAMMDKLQKAAGFEVHFSRMETNIDLKQFLGIK